LRSRVASIRGPAIVNLARPRGESTPGVVATMALRSTTGFSRCRSIEIFSPPRLRRSGSKTATRRLWIDRDRIKLAHSRRYR